MTVSCRNLTKKYGAYSAVNNISLTLGGGRIIGLLGPNGSGKTTLIKMINGLLTPSSGELLIDGRVPGVESKKHISYLPERTYLNMDMRVRDLLRYFADFYADFDMEACAPDARSARNPGGRPAQNNVQGHKGEGAAHSGDEPARAAIRARRAHRRHRPCGPATISSTLYSPTLTRGRAFCCPPI